MRRRLFLLVQVDFTALFFAIKLAGVNQICMKNAYECVKEDTFVCSSRCADSVTLCAEVFISLLHCDHVVFGV